MVENCRDNKISSTSKDLKPHAYNRQYSAYINVNVDDDDARCTQRDGIPLLEESKVLVPQYPCVLTEVIEQHRGLLRPAGHI